MTVGLGLKDVDSPASSFPRLKYTVTGNPTIDRKFRQAALAYNPTVLAVRGVNVTGSGKAEYLHVRNEEAVRVDLFCEQDELRQLFDYFRDHGALGAQAEFWINRNLGSVWQFEDNLLDENGLALLLNGGGTLAFEDATDGRGVKLTGTQYLSVATAQQSAATPTGFDDPLDKAQGVILIDFKPAWAGNDSALHQILDTSGTTANRLMIYKTAANALTLEIRDNAGGVKTKSGAVTWTANTRVQIVAFWDTSGTLKLWYATGSGSFTELTTSGGAGTGIITTLGATLYVGAENDGTDLALGTYDTVATFRLAFSQPLGVVGLRPPWRNYFQCAELVPLTLEPQQAPSIVRHIFRWPLIVRQGEA